jgi:acetyl esterase/lipase
VQLLLGKYQYSPVSDLRRHVVLAYDVHSYVIWRYARKMHGRCFAVNYRSIPRSPLELCIPADEVVPPEAPQYPFPCAIQDCLAAWMYLTNPPPGSKHKPVLPKNIILAGDSAGGGLVWALLQILRDTPGLELPAGAVLVSPVSQISLDLRGPSTDIRKWSDMTHSFPSILSNTATVDHA